jgi:heptose I phosphotransferase
MRTVGLDADAVFTHAQIVAWRKLPDRENCTLDSEFDGKPIRLHIKRYLRSPSAAADEVKAIELLREAQIPTVPLVGWGSLADGRSFVITADLAGYRDAEKLIESGGVTFQTLLEPTADLASRLHRTGLHHRDLYLCHFFARVEGANVDVKLIDAARVGRLRGLTKRRWIIKDLAQFWYSTLAHPAVTDEHRRRWLERYAGHVPSPRFVRAIERKVRAIGRHDAKLKKAQPTRNISIPTS